MKTRLLALMAMVLLVAAVGWRINQTKRKEEADKAAAAAANAEETALPIRVASVMRKDMVNRVVVSGAIRPRNEVDVFTKLPGRLESVHVKVGDRVGVGQTLATVEHREAQWQVKQAEATVALARANLELQESNLARTQQLFDTGSIAEQQLSAARSSVAITRAQLQQAQAVLGLAETSLSNARVVAPIGGVVTRKVANVGTQATVSLALFTIQDVAEMKLEAGVDALSIARLTPHSPVEVSVDAYPGERFSGRISIIAPTLDPVTRRATIEVALPNADRRLLANMFARGVIDLGALPGVLTVPAGAIVEEGGEMQLYTVREGRVVVLTPRVLGVDGDTVAVDGIVEGDVVAVQGQKQLRGGSKVQPVVAGNKG